MFFALSELTRGLFFYCALSGLETPVFVTQAFGLCYCTAPFQGFSSLFISSFGFQKRNPNPPPLIGGASLREGRLGTSTSLSAALGSASRELLRRCSAMFTIIQGYLLLA